MSARPPTNTASAPVRAIVGNAVGDWLGGMTLAAGLGFTSPISVGAALTAAGLGVRVVADRLARRGTTRGVPGLQPALDAAR